MKKTMIISLLCLSAISSFAQSADDEATRRAVIHERAKAIYCETNGNMGPAAKMHYKTNYSNVHATYPDAPANAIPAKPTGKYVALQDPPCYRYKNSKGSWVTKCPGASFEPRHCDLIGTTSVIEAQSIDNAGFQSERTFTGNYPSLQSVYPGAPANAQPAWPKSPYTELQNPPCYKYINKRGLEVTECPGARFEPEHKYR